MWVWVKIKPPGNGPQALETMFPFTVRFLILILDPHPCVFSMPKRSSGASTLRGEKSETSPAPKMGIPRQLFVDGVGRLPVWRLRGSGSGLFHPQTRTFNAFMVVVWKHFPFLLIVVEWWKFNQVFWGFGFPSQLTTHQEEATGADGTRGSSPFQEASLNSSSFCVVWGDVQGLGTPARICRISRSRFSSSRVQVLGSPNAFMTPEKCR